jgi:hypothetical protein
MVGSVSLGKVQTRLLIVIGWLLGMGTATGISLLAVSLLGQGIASAPGQQLTEAAVNRALASENSSAARSAPARPRRPKPVPRHTRPPSPSPAPASKDRPARSGRHDYPLAGGTLLTSPGGSVVAGCGHDGAYLVSWSPQQGYEVTSVVRGPAYLAQATFRSGRDTVTMTVSCQDGMPSAHSDSGHQY